MRHTLTLLGILLSFQVFSQFNYSSVQNHLELNQISQFKSSLIESESSISYSSYAADDIYARDNAEDDTNLSRYHINNGGSQQYGNIFDIYANDTLYAVRIRLDSRTGTNAKGKILINSVDPNNGSNKLSL